MDKDLKPGGYQMKKLLLGSVALAALGIGAPAIAADMAVRPAAPPAFSWTGCHIAGLVGYESGRDNGYSTSAGSTFIAVPPASRQTIPAVAGTPLTSSLDMSGFNGGAGAGCDYQFGAWVVGVDGDWSNTNKEGQAFIVSHSANLAVAAVGGGTFTMLGNDVWQSQERWFATARARVGYAVDRWLLYVTGGGAWMRINSTECNLSPFVCGNTGVVQSDTRRGWTVGAGVEYAPTILKGNWTLRSEYLYIRISDYTTFTPGDGPGYATIGWIENLNHGRIENHIVRFGLAYKFGPNSAAQFR
jgi:outer membrane immunogenic protein